SSSAVVRYWRSDFFSAPAAAGSSASTEAKAADRVACPSTVNVLVDRIVTVDAFWLRPMRTVGSACGCGAPASSRTIARTTWRIHHIVHGLYHIVFSDGRRASVGSLVINGQPRC